MLSFAAAAVVAGTTTSAYGQVEEIDDFVEYLESLAAPAVDLLVSANETLAEEGKKAVESDTQKIQQPPPPATAVEPEVEPQQQQQQQPVSAPEIPVPEWATAEKKVIIPQTWTLGADLQIGDTYHFVACGQYTIQELNTRCFDITLNFVHYTQNHHVYGSDVWVIEATYARNAGFGQDGLIRAAHYEFQELQKEREIQQKKDAGTYRQYESYRSPDTESLTRNTILLLDAHTMRVYSTNTWDDQIADALQSTVLRITEFTNPVRGGQVLSVGSHWGDLISYHYDIPIAVDRITDKYHIEDYVGNNKHATTTLTGVAPLSIVSYKGQEHQQVSETVIDPHVPFPVYSKWYEPNDQYGEILLHEFKLYR